MNTEYLKRLIYSAPLVFFVALYGCSGENVFVPNSVAVNGDQSFNILTVQENIHIFKGTRSDELQRLIDSLPVEEEVTIKLAADIEGIPRPYETVTIDGKTPITTDVSLVLADRHIHIMGDGHTFHSNSSIGLLTEGGNVSLYDLKFADGVTDLLQYGEESAHIMSQGGSVSIDSVSIDGGDDIVGKAATGVDRGPVGLYAQNGAEVTVLNSDFSNTAWDAITANNANVTVLNTEISGTNQYVNGGTGIGVIGGQLRVENSKIVGKSKGILLLEGTKGVVRGVAVKVGNPRLGAPGYGISVDKKSSIVMTTSTVVTSDIAVQAETTDAEGSLISGNAFLIDTSRIGRGSRLYSAAGRGDKPPILFWNPIAGANFKGNVIYYVPDSRFKYPEGLTSMSDGEALVNGNKFIQVSSSEVNQ